MPYDVKNVPDKIKGLPKHAQEIWIKAYNNALKQYGGDEEKANATAWSAVQKSGYKKKGDKWVKASEEPFGDFKEIDFDKPLQVFKAGIYPQGEYTTKDLDQMIKNFNPGYHEPPVVMDHATMGSAHGWVKKIWREGKVLWASLKDLSQELMDKIKSGEYKKISIAIYNDFEGTDEYKKPGKGRALKHLSFLGAGIPQVKGLKAFDEDVHGKFAMISSEEKISEFESKEKDNNKGGQEMSEERMKELIDAATKKLTTEFEAKEKVFNDKVDTLADKNKTLKEELDASNKQFSEQEKKTLRTEIHAFCEALKVKGDFIPAWGEMGVEKFLEALALNGGDAVKFSEADDAKEITLYHFFREFLKSLPKVVTFKELSKEDEKGKSTDRDKLYQVGDSHANLKEKNIELAKKATEIFNEKRKDNPGYTYAEAAIEASREVKEED